MKCTWKDCEEPGTHRQTAADGEVWANLCDAHNKELDWAVLQSGEQGNVKALLSAWVKAQGGSKKAAARMVR